MSGFPQSITWGWPLQGRVIYLIYIYHYIPAPFKGGVEQDCLLQSSVLRIRRLQLGLVTFFYNWELFLFFSFLQLDSGPYSPSSALAKIGHLCPTQVSAAYLAQLLQREVAGFIFSAFIYLQTSYSDFVILIIF